MQSNPKDKNNRRIVAYASRILSERERKFPQVEREAHSVIFGCERFHIFLFGKEFDLVTDNKAVHFIFLPEGNGL